MMSFFLLGGFIACAGKHVGASCPVVMSPPAVVVAFGNSFSVNCTSLSNQIDGMGWESSAGAGPNISSMSTKREEMTVLYPPTFFKPANETVEIKAKSKLLLNCTATGNPAPVYSWDHPRPSEQTNEDKNENPPIFSPSYHLPGNYSCTVSNSQGTKTKYFNVIQEPGNRTTFAAIVAVFVCLGILLFIAGFFFVTPNGSFSLNTGSYMGGQPVPSGPV
ncbi:neural cell adhesion molecule L1-like protein isoform X3 [Channa argus]|uniref:neural cell adhesion molecule L1-like protein isoform X3 n=1 Tax=Channa argus TaxID=215402 RepID=UPI00352045E4